MYNYQWEVQATVKKAKYSITDYKFDFSPSIINSHKNKLDILFKVPNLRKDLYIVGEFNNWGKTDFHKYKLKNEDEFSTITLKELQNKAGYLFTDGEIFLRDPASLFFDNNANSVIWNFTEGYKFNHKKPDLLNKSLRILQTDLQGLIYYFKNKENQFGKDFEQHNYYKFITQSGVIKAIKDLGFNAIQFLPVSQSIDGDKWSFRYLVPYLFAIDKKYGNPDDFKEMVDEFHKHGVAFILDFVISHLPFRDYSLFKFNGEDIGSHLWGIPFVDEETPWGTKRYNYNSSVAQKFIIDSALHYLKNYNIDGLRIDNIDGILRYGNNGDGPERPNGRNFLRKLNSEIYTYYPKTIISYESHYFYNDNAKQLVAKLDSSQTALGATAYTSSRETYFFHSDYMPKSADDISPWRIKEIIDEKEWGESNSTIADFHNHDAAAGLMVNRATGSYAYDALTLGNSYLHKHAVGKIKVMESIISFGLESRTLDLLQTFLLQEGTFEHETGIQWELLNQESSKGVLNFKSQVNKILDNEDFWAKNVQNRKIINIDEKSKTITLIRSKFSDYKSGFLVLINMSSFISRNFQIPTFRSKVHKLILNSDELQYSGDGLGSWQNNYTPEITTQFEYFTKALDLEVIPAYATLIWKF